jgi:hypothetical protein
MKIKITKIIFPEIKISQRDSHKLRGYFGNFFKEESPLLHNHFENGESKYCYPLVQYKVIKKNPILIGINEGSILLNELFLRIKELVIENNIYKITDKQIETWENKLDISNEMIKYKFHTLWLALNQNNYKIYYSYVDDEDKEYLLKKIIIGNILSMYKYLGFRANKEIKINLKVKEKITKFKEQEMLGFSGYFSTNAIIPSYLGIGKSVSRGFGTVIEA